MEMFKEQYNLFIYLFYSSVKKRPIETLHRNDYNMSLKRLMDDCFQFRLVPRTYCKQYENPMQCQVLNVQIIAVRLFLRDR